MKLTMRLGPRSYDIILRRGALGRVGQLVNLSRKVLVVTDSGVPQQYLSTVLAQCPQGVPVVLEQGEGSKSLAVTERLCAAMLQHGFARTDAVLALGGGVVGDAAGFAAACYMRGIDFINCPTTTLAQVDSSIGGKTAVNLAGTKNIVGAFHQPCLVVADPDTLATLPPRHVANGLAEAVKTGLIGDAALFELFEKDAAQQSLEEILYRSLAVKKAIVEADEREAGCRAALNFGHTIGHAIEASRGLARRQLYHGECVALGTLPMLESPAVRARVRRVYRALGLPVRIRYDGDEIYSHLVHDKKAANGAITLVKVKQPGSYRLEKVPVEALRAVIGEGIGCTTHTRAPSRFPSSERATARRWGPRFRALPRVCRWTRRISRGRWISAAPRAG